MNYWMILFRVLIFVLGFVGLIFLIPYLLERPIFGVILMIILVVGLGTKAVWKDMHYKNSQEFKIEQKYSSVVKKTKLLQIFKNIDDYEYLRKVFNDLKLKQSIIDMEDETNVELNNTINDLLISKYSYLKDVDETLDLENIVKNAKLKNKILAKDILDYIKDGPKLW